MNMMNNWQGIEDKWGKRGWRRKMVERERERERWGWG
jgi:hypothetical protein